MQDTVTTSALLDPSHSSVSTQDKSSTGGHTSSTGPQPSKPSITPVSAKSRNPHPGANFHRMRRIIAEDPEWSLAIVPLLTELCIQHIIRNFQSESVPALGRKKKAKSGARWVGLSGAKTAEPGSWGSPCSPVWHPHTYSTLPFHPGPRQFLLLFPLADPTRLPPTLHPPCLCPLLAFSTLSNKTQPEPYLLPSPESLPK